MSAIEEFRRFIADACGTDPGHIVADGRWHAFRIDGTRHKSSRPGRYILHDDERPVGWFMDWRDEKMRHRWLGGGTSEAIDRDEVRRRQEQRRADRERSFANASVAATKFWSGCTRINGASHPYLERKSIGPNGARYGSGEKFGLGREQCVILPISDAEGGALSLQAIRGDGERRFWPGSSHEGGHFTIGKDDGASAIVFCEGYATGASIHEATGLLTVVCLNTGNMASVARWAGHKWHGRRMIVAGDDDWHLVGHPKVKRNVGREEAERMARTLGGVAVFSDMQGLVTEGGDDFNDMAREIGVAEVAETFHALIKTDPSPPDSPLPLEWFDDIDASLSANWLVEDLIPAGGLCLVYGHPGCGKSFFALDLAMHVAGGERWRDRAVEKGLVVYIGAEGQRGLRQRVAAFRQHYGVTNLPFALVPVETDLLSEQGDLEKVIETIRLASARFDLPVAATVIDTLSRTFGGGDEVGSDMVAYVNNVGRIQREFGCTAMVIHHRPKDSANETPRGHGSLWGACDTIILVEDMGGIKQAKNTKQKDGEIANPVLFGLHVVELGEDDKGKPVTSCVVVPSESEIIATGVSNRLSDGQQIALQQLKITLDETGVYTSHGVPETALPKGSMVKVSRVSEWQFRTTSVMASPDKSPDTLRRTFQRYRERLQRLQFIGIHEDWVWLAH